MEACLSDIFDLENRSSKKTSSSHALQEAEQAIQQVLEGTPEVELSPQNSYVRRRQHELARAADLASRSQGKEPHRRVRIYRE
jgi:predicted RNA-binding protein Jag